MAHLTLHLGAGLVVPFSPRRWGRQQMVRFRRLALREAGLSPATRTPGGLARIMFTRPALVARPRSTR